MLFRIPEPFPTISMPLLFATVGASFVISKFCTVIYWTLYKYTVDAAPAPLRTGFGPMPYLSNTIGAPLAPEPIGCNVPVQEEPALNSTLSPAPKVMLFTFDKLCQGAAALVPLFVSFPASEST
ncbi:hypothetical protein D3C85_1232750 [compost metagenome]